MATTNKDLMDDGRITVIRDTVTQPERAVVVTTSDTTTFAESCLYVGTQGNLSVETSGGDVLTFVGVLGWFPVKVVKVRATGTTALNIVRLFN